MDRFHTMQVFTAVAESSSFAKAGRALHLSPPAVTRAITALEERLGTKLFLRTTRSVRLTEAGSRFLADCHRILHDVEEAEEAAAGVHAAPRGVLHVTASVLFGRHYVTPLLRDFVDAYPNVTIDAVFVDRVVNMIEEGHDVAIRIGDLPDSSLTAIRVGSIRRVMFGTPAYFAAHGYPRHPHDLTSHRTVWGLGALPTVDAKFGPRDRELSVRLKPAMVFNGLDSVVDCVLSSWAIARVLSYQITPHIESGRLEIVLPEFEPDPMPIHVVHREGRRASAKVRAFVDFAVDRLRAISFQL